MANIKWSGIESWKYRLTARWYVSAYYGNDTDIDSVGLYDPSTNQTGHGGPTRPFATIEAAYQNKSSDFEVVVVDSGYYTVNSTLSKLSIVGDGIVVLTNNLLSYGFNSCVFYNCDIISSGTTQCAFIDSKCLYSMIGIIGGSSDSDSYNTIFLESTITQARDNYFNCNFINCSGSINIVNESNFTSAVRNNVFIGCSNLELILTSTRPSGYYVDYSVIIGTVKTNVSINSKTTGVTIEDFKANGNYFIKSYSEVDLFGNTSGSGATTTQLNTIFNNYYSPIYIDDYHNLDLTLKPTADERVRFGGLNGTYIGALPVGYRFSAYDLWNTYQDAANTSNLEYDTINNAIVLKDGEDVGIFTSTEIDLGTPITVDMVDFFANLVYNSDGTVKEGVANQRIDTTPDLIPDNTENQRVVYDYRIQYASDGSSALSSWINLELNRQPTEDGSGNYQLDDGFDPDTASKLTIQRFKIEFTLRRVIIA